MLKINEDRFERSFTNMVTKILTAPDGPPSDVERIKRESDYLRGTLKESMAEPLSSGISDDDNRLMKHHGSYLQDDRDLRNERQKQKLEPLINSCFVFAFQEEWQHQNNGWH